MAAAVCVTYVFFKRKEKRGKRKEKREKRKEKREKRKEKRGKRKEENNKPQRWRINFERKQ
ncbi:hypothetical protein B0A58_02575 [Flavobacterium branchiophilum NBRC 15030 = ATCC 35035]|uniref:hypothetical protein n=1 Tax=Flavobacterium branchiophilum TaxID=55197 RepID=UPI000B5BD5E6|nr:hypothetical protein [Flavobacterium branchiophilum]OXA80215.1 hypothetical protein B0A58_02575 [Flavobacterium branchiophilum NBRC 15030 = ATCC 35035]